MLKEKKDKLYVERTTKGDLIKIHKILLEGFPKKLLPFTFYQYPSYIQYLEKIMSDHCLLCLYVNSEVVGFAHFMELNSDTLFLNNIYIKDEFQGKGGGSKLINYGIDWGIQRNLTSFELDVIKSNTNATKLYKKIGFRKKRDIIWHLFDSDFKEVKNPEIALNICLEKKYLDLEGQKEEVPIFNRSIFRIKHLELLEKKELKDLLIEREGIILYISEDEMNGVKPFEKQQRMHKRLI